MIFSILCIFAKNVLSKLPTNSKITIIGAGPSGIAALSKLLENGYKNVVLLEASNRIGGRINTVPFASNVIDLGAQWIHGQVGNIVYEMVKNQSLTDVTPESYFEGWLISSEGSEENDYDTLSVLCDKINYICDTVRSMPFNDFFIPRYF